MKFNLKSRGKEKRARERQKRLELIDKWTIDKESALSKLGHPVTELKDKLIEERDRIFSEDGKYTRFIKMVGPYMEDGHLGDVIASINFGPLKGENDLETMERLGIDSECHEVLHRLHEHLREIGIIP